jgi:hypothetical protein
MAKSRTSKLLSSVFIGKFTGLFVAPISDNQKGKSNSFLNLKRATVEEIERDRCKQYEYVA